MALDPSHVEQQRIMRELRVREGGLVDREAVVERLAGGAFVAVAGALAARGATRGPALLCAALAAQFAADVAVSELRESAVRPFDLLRQIRELWVVMAIDAALAPVGYLVGLQAHDHPWAPFALIPLLCVLGVFARERRERVRSLAELSSAYRGTAYVLGDVVEADDGYTAEHSKGVVQLVMD